MPRLRHAVRGPPLTRGGCGAAHGRPGARAGSVLAAISSCRDRVPSARTDRPGPARRGIVAPHGAHPPHRGRRRPSRHPRGAPHPGRPHRDRSRRWPGRARPLSAGRRRPGGDGHRDARDRRAGGIAGAPGHAAARAGHCDLRRRVGSGQDYRSEPSARCTARARVTPPPQKPPDAGREHHEQEHGEHVEVLDGDRRTRQDDDEARHRHGRSQDIEGIGRRAIGP